jgi:hypothetical protein
MCILIYTALFDGKQYMRIQPTIQSNSRYSKLYHAHFLLFFQQLSLILFYYKTDLDTETVSHSAKDQWHGAQRICAADENMLPSLYLLAPASMRTCSAPMYHKQYELFESHQMNPFNMIMW